LERKTLDIRDGGLEDISLPPPLPWREEGGGDNCSPPPRSKKVSGIGVLLSQM